MDKNNESKFFNIQAAAEMSGLSAHTIRAWEKRYKALTPSRNDTGKRMYNEQELERLKVLALLVNFGSSISQIANLSDQELNEMLGKLTQTRSKWASPVTMGKEQVAALVGPILNDLLTYNIEGMSQNLIMARDSANTRDLVFHLLIPLLSELKQLDHHQGLKVGHIHALKSLIRLHAAWALVPRVDKTTDDKIFIASIDGTDATESILVSLLCHNYHHNFFYSHIPLPLPVMVETAISLKARAIVLHLAHPIEASFFQQIVKTVPPHIAIWIKSGEQSPIAGRKIHFYQDYNQLEELLLHS